MTAINSMETQFRAALRCLVARCAEAWPAPVEIHAELLHGHRVPNFEKDKYAPPYDLYRRNWEQQARAWGLHLPGHFCWGPDNLLIFDYKPYDGDVDSGVDTVERALQRLDRYFEKRDRYELREDIV